MMDVGRTYETPVKTWTLTLRYPYFASPNNLDNNTEFIKKVFKIKREQYSRLISNLDLTNSAIQMKDLSPYITQQSSVTLILSIVHTNYCTEYNTECILIIVLSITQCALWLLYWVQHSVHTDYCTEYNTVWTLFIVPSTNNVHTVYCTEYKVVYTMILLFSTTATYMNFLTWSTLEQYSYFNSFQRYKSAIFRKNKLLFTNTSYFNTLLRHNL
jgi:hypothetical protein